MLEFCLGKKLQTLNEDSAHADLIINVELTTNAETMTHRIGRAGRFGNCGEAVFILGGEQEITGKG